MSAHTILLVDDDPQQRSLMALHLSQAGFRVVTAADGGEAVDKAHQSRPDAMVSDVVMPVLDGFKLCEAVRHDPELATLPVVLISAAAIEEPDLRLAEAVGASAYVARTPECEALIGALQTSLLEEPLPPAQDSERFMAALRREFLDSGVDESLRVVQMVKGGTAGAPVRQLAHRWAGMGGTFGFPEISRLAFRIEELADGREEVELQSALQEMAHLFLEAAGADHGGPELAADVVRELAGRRIVLVGFEGVEGSTLVRTLERAAAVTLSLSAGKARPDAPELAQAELILLSVSPGLAGTPWSEPDVLTSVRAPVVLVGSRDLLLGNHAVLRERAADFLFSPCHSEELLLRAARVVRGQPEPAATLGRGPVLAVDDDLGIAALVAACLKSHQVTCEIARNGREALAMAARLNPSALVLDINMPEMDGFEVLAALKRDPQTARIPVVLLTARQQEADVLRGFGLGADDYVTKPFGPMELVARVKRLLATVPATAAAS